MPSRNGKRPRKKAKGRRKTAQKTAPSVMGSAGVAISPITGAAIPLGNHPGNTGGKPGRSGRPMMLTKRLAARKMPKHVSTLDNIAHGKSFTVLAEKCPKCGYEPDENSQPEVVTVKPGDQVRAIEELRKLAASTELVITTENARAFFDCTDKAIKELVAPYLVDQIHDRARALFKASQKAS